MVRLGHHLSCLVRLTTRHRGIDKTFRTTRVAHAAADHVDAVSVRCDFAAEADAESVDVDVAGIHGYTVHVHGHAAARHGFDVVDHRGYYD